MTEQSEETNQDEARRQYLDAGSRTEVMAHFLCEHDHAGDTDWPYGTDESSTRRRWFYRALARDVLEKVAEMGGHFGDHESTANKETQP